MTINTNDFPAIPDDVCLVEDNQCTPVVLADTDTLNNQSTEDVLDDYTATKVAPQPDGVVTLFSRFSPDDLIDEKTLAKEFHKDERTIRRWGREGRLPPALPLPGKFRRVGNILQFFLVRVAGEEKKALAYQQHLDKLKR